MNESNKKIIINDKIKAIEDEIKLLKKKEAEKKILLKSLISKAERISQAAWLTSIGKVLCDYQEVLSLEEIKTLLHDAAAKKPVFKKEGGA